MLAASRLSSIAMAIGACLGAGCERTPGNHSPPAQAPIPLTSDAGGASFGSSALPLPPGAVARLGTGGLRHASMVRAIAFSPDGRFVASTGLDGAVRIHSRATGRQVAAIAIGGEALGDLAYSPDGALLAVVVQGEGIRIYGVATRAQLRAIPGAISALTPVVFLDGSSAIGAVIAGHLEIVDVASGRRLARLGDGHAVVGCLAATDRWVVWAEETPAGSTLRAWDRRAGGSGAAIPLTSAPEKVALSPDGAWIAVTNATPQIVVIPRDRPADARTTPLDASAERLAFAPDGRTLALASQDGSVDLRDVASGRKVWSFVHRRRGLVTSATYAVFAPDGRTVAAAAGGDASVLLLDAATGQREPTSEGHLDTVDAVAFLGADRVVTSGWDDQVLVWQRDAAGAFHPVERYRARAAALAASGPAALTVLERVHRSDGGFGIDAIEIPGGARRPLVPGGATPLGDAVALSADGQRVAFVPTAGALAILGPGATSTRANVPLKAPLESLLFSADGALLAGAEMGGGHVHVWRTADGALVRTLPFAPRERLTLAWSPSGARLAVGAAALLGPVRPGTSTLHVFGIPSAKEELSLPLAFHPGARMAFTPDGLEVVVPIGEAAVLIDARTGAELHRFEGHAARVEAAAVAGSGALMATGSADATVLLWASPPLR
jgi:WD40 repeat protein